MSWWPEALSSLSCRPLQTAAHNMEAAFINARRARESVNKIEVTVFSNIILEVASIIFTIFYWLEASQ